MAKKEEEILLSPAYSYIRQRGEEIREYQNNGIFFVKLDCQPLRAE